jgi:DnaK suppressor protein
MDTDRIETLRGYILERIATVKADISSYKSNTRPVAPDNAIGRLTRMEALNSKSINEAALYTARGSLENLERALTMLDDPDFGYCRQCEEPIPYARLMIVPEALFCVQCAEKMGA